ncbi:MAG TPA: hypothetical protein VJ740_15320, partial [Hyphomicrobiaceae bacterium]|nr:hypothetical protein [Hyphomicrobiaceae bacterium]
RWGVRWVKRFVVDCRAVNSFDDFVNAMNQDFIRLLGGEWDGNLDAFNDYLKWPNDEYQLEIVGSARCADALGYEATAAWLRNKLLTCHPSNVANVRKDLAAAEDASGKTLFDVIREIMGADACAHVILS